MVDRLARGLDEPLDALLVRRAEALLEGRARLDDVGQVDTVSVELADGLVREDEMELHAPGLLEEDADVLRDDPLELVDEDVDTVLSPFPRRLAAVSSENNASFATFGTVVCSWADER